MAVIFPKLVRNLFRNSIKYQLRYVHGEEASKWRGLVVGAYLDPESKEQKLTQGGHKFNSQVGGKLEEVVKREGPIHAGKAIVFQHLDPEYHSVAVVGLGKHNEGYNPLENLDQCKEHVRVAAAVGARELERQGAGTIQIDGMGSPESAAEGASLALWRYQECLSAEHHKHIPHLELYGEEDKEEWERGLFKAESQNLARRLTDAPGNLMTPAVFAQHTVDLLCPCGIGVEVYDRDWAEHHKFRLFLHVARGSCEPPIVLKLSYCGGMQDEKPIVLVGSGITFDAGGLCLKHCKGMDKYRGDMAGAAVVVALMRAMAVLSLPINVNAIVPLCENMPSGMAMRPGDIIHSMNNKTVIIDDTDNEGRMVIADALAFSSMTYKARLMIDVGTLTEGMVASVGNAATGVYTTSHELWREMEKAGAITGDRVWRFPLWRYFTKKVAHLRHADVTNKGHGPGGGPCRAAAFLREFVDCNEWVHCDIAGSGLIMETEDTPYMAKGRMTGRPVRMLLQLLYQLACPNKSEHE